MNLRIGEMLLLDVQQQTWHKYYGDRSVRALRELLEDRRVEKQPVRIYLQSCLKRHLYHRLDVTPKGVEYYVQPVAVADSEIRADEVSEAARALGRRSSARKAAASRSNGRRRWLGGGAALLLFLVLLSSCTSKVEEAGFSVSFRGEYIVSAVNSRGGTDYLLITGGAGDKEWLWPDVAYCLGEDAGRLRVAATKLMGQGDPDGLLVVELFIKSTSIFSSSTDVVARDEAPVGDSGASATATFTRK